MKTGMKKDQGSLPRFFLSSALYWGSVDGQEYTLPFKKGDTKKKGPDVSFSTGTLCMEFPFPD
jgi:hypothetical protein